MPSGRAATCAPGSHRSPRRSRARRPGSRRPPAPRRRPPAPRAHGQLRDLRDGQPRPGHRRDVGERDKPGTWRDRCVEGGQRRVVVAARAGVHERQVDAEPGMQRMERPDPTGVLELGRHGPVAGAPVKRRDRLVHPVGRGVVERDGVDVRAEDRGRRAARLVHPGEELLEVVDVRAAGAQLPRLEVGHGLGRLGRQRPDRARVQVDPRLDRRQRRADRGELLLVRHEGGDHGRMIRTCSVTPLAGCRRRDRADSPRAARQHQWLAEKIGRPELRILDVRWRPDGSGPRDVRRGPHPGRRATSTGGPS